MAEKPATASALTLTDAHFAPSRLEARILELERRLAESERRIAELEYYRHAHTTGKPMGQPPWFT